MKRKILTLVLVLCMVAVWFPTSSAFSANVPTDAATYNGHSYRVYNTGMTWQEARVFCENLGGHLVTVTSLGEQSFIEGLLYNSDKTACWIGLTDENSYNDWRWITGEPFQYSNWREGEPSHVDKWGEAEQYVGLWVTREGFGEWNDFSNTGNPYTNQIGLICEWDTVSKYSDWAEPEIKKAEEMGLIPDKLQNTDLTKPITRAEFAAVCVKLYEKLTGIVTVAGRNPFSDTNDPDVLKAFSTDILVGTATDKFSPDVILNREQAATALTRVIKRAYIPGWTYATDIRYVLIFPQPLKFPDDAKISDWARQSVYFMASNGIIKGMGNGDFAPRNTTSAEEAIGYANNTREQALVLAVRMVENLKDKELLFVGL